MSALLLKLKNVPEDEYQEVCELLEQNDLAYYETASGFWGVGLAAIWLYDESQLPKAQALLNEYSQDRQLAIQKEFEALKEKGAQRTLYSTFRQQPVTFILYLLALAAVLALSVLPFLSFD